MSTDPLVAIDDPRSGDVRALIETHFNASRDNTPAGYSFAMDAEALTGPDMSFFTARRDGTLLGMVALKRLDDTHGEIKSMHTTESARGRGIGRAMLDHVLAHARAHGFSRVSLETGTTDEYGPARSLYLSAGFRPCGPFGSYSASPHNTFMTMTLDHYCAERAR